MANDRSTKHTHWLFLYSKLQSKESGLSLRMAIVMQEFRFSSQVVYFGRQQK